MRTSWHLLCLSHRDAVGLALAAALAILLFVALRPNGPPQSVTGRVVSIGNSGGRSPTPVAVVQVDDRRVKVKVPLSTSCWVGSEIALLRGQDFLGPTYSPALVPNACRRAG